MAKIVHGLAYAPADAPMQVKKAIWAGDAIRHKRYVFGGGHGTWGDTGYDCSGSVSYVLHAAGLLKISMDSSGFLDLPSGPTEPSQRDNLLFLLFFQDIAHIDRG